MLKTLKYVSIKSIARKNKGDVKVKNNKAAIVIAALMIASMTFAISTPIISADPPTATLGTPSVKASTRELITITVVNNLSENIENVLIRELSGAFENAIGGATTKEILENVADNLSAAAAQLSQVGENLKEAALDKIAAGVALEAAADALDTAGLNLIASTRENATAAGTYLSTADEYLRLAADLLQVEPENLVLIGIYLENAATRISLAAAILSGDATPALSDAGDNLYQAADRLDNYVENGLVAGILWRAGDNLDNAANYVRIAGQTMSGYGGTGDVNIKLAANLLDNTVGKQMAEAGARLKRAAENIKEAGTALNTIVDLYLDNVENQIRAADENLLEAANYLERADNRLREVAMALKMENAENILLGGENLYYAADNLAAAAIELGKVLGQDGLSSAATSLTTAANKLKSSGTFDMTAGGNAIISAATGLSTAAAKIGETAGKLKPNAATLTEDLPTAKDVNFGGENIVPGGTKEFTFIWSTPTITTETDYTLRVWAYYGGAWHALTPDLTISVDGKAPSLSIVVTQENVALNNLVGDVYQGGKATITITADEQLSAIGAVTIRDNSTAENMTPVIFLTTTDNTVFTGEFTVGAWDDNIDIVVYVAKPCATDLHGIVKDENATSGFVVDTRAPVLLDNGLPGLLTNMDGGQKVQAGTGKVYWVDNQRAQTISGNVEDNWTAGDRLTKDNVETILNVTVEWDSLSAAWAPTPAPTPDNSFSVSMTLGEGKTSLVKVTAKDWTGNTVSYSVENIFVDLNKATASLVSIAGLTPSQLVTQSNRINDSTPTFVISLTDPGYPTTGLGIFKENVLIRLLLDDGTVVRTMDNTAPWTVGGGDWTTENSTALTENWYSVEVRVNDNLWENFMENVVRFYVDLTAPAVTEPTAAVNPLDGTTFISPLVRTTTSLTIRGTTTGAEVGSTINIYIKNAATGVTAETETTTVESGGTWSGTITLPLEGVEYQIEVSCTDLAGNEGSSVLYGFVLADVSTPWVEISAVEVAGVPLTSPYSTDQATVVILGTIDKDSWETYNSGVRAVTATIQVGSAAPGALTIGSSGAFSISAALDTVGTYTITVRATDSVGHSDSETVTIVRVAPPTTTTTTTTTTPPPPADTSAPTVTLDTLPASTTDASITVSGTVTKDTAETYSDITLTVQVGLTSVTVPISADGSYEYTVPLSMGPNTIAVQAVDRSGNASTPRTAQIERVAPPADTSAPTVTLGTLPASTDAASITITGTVTKDSWETYSDITVRVQSSLTSVEVQAGTNGSFSASVGLVEGSNTIVVQAVDSSGNASTSATATVTRTVTPWATYAIVIVIITLVLAAIAIFRKR